MFLKEVSNLARHELGSVEVDMVRPLHPGQLECWVLSVDAEDTICNFLLLIFLTLGSLVKT